MIINKTTIRVKFILKIKKVYLSELVKFWNELMETTPQIFQKIKHSLSHLTKNEYGTKKTPLFLEKFEIFYLLDLNVTNSKRRKL
jgi:hypothetical protein